MTNPFLAKMEHATQLSADEREALRSLTARGRRVDRGHDLLQKGDYPSTTLIVLEGLACRHQVLPDGRRSITSLLVPGDACHAPMMTGGRLNDGVATLTQCNIAEVPHNRVIELMAHYSAIAKAFWWAIIVDSSIQREWFVSVSSRLASTRTAHLFCEIIFRLQAVGLANENTFYFPLTQEEIGNMLGLSLIHMNRTLQVLRSKRLIILQKGWLTVPDPASLQAYAGFSPHYLYLNQTFI